MPEPAKLGRPKLKVAEKRTGFVAVHLRPRELAAIQAAARAADRPVGAWARERILAGVPHA